MRRPMRPPAGSPDIIVRWERVELVRMPGLLVSLGEKQFKLKLHLQTRKLQTYHDCFPSWASDTFSEPSVIPASTNLHAILRISLQTNVLSRNCAELKMPLRQLELLARAENFLSGRVSETSVPERPYTFTLPGSDGQPLALVSCWLSVKLNYTREELRALALAEEAALLALLPPNPMAALCARMSRYFRGPPPEPEPLSQPELELLRQKTASFGTRNTNIRRVSIHPDFMPVIRA
ncbi:hypothetical protein T492DRAFT_1022723 [Pavlovales sp. CCMP2436]|nr:hypothetical protein T492DRAFT_1022723 [Pavlovales sp. CCMP2436]